MVKNRVAIADRWAHDCGRWLFAFLLLFPLAHLWGQDSLWFQPRMYAQSLEAVEEPTYVVTGKHGCLLAWAPGRYKATETNWRIQVVDARSMVVLVEMNLSLESNLTLDLTQEAEDGKGAYLLFSSARHARQVVLVYVRYADGVTEADRFTVPLDYEPEALIVSPLGAYVQAKVEDLPVLFYLDPESHQGKVLAFGPDKANRLLGVGLEPATGRLWLGVARRGSNPGPTPNMIRVYIQGEAIAEYPLTGFDIDQGPTHLYLQSDSVEGLWLGFWGRRAAEIPQGPFSLKNFALVEQRRFVDSASFFYNEAERSARRHFRKYSRRRGFVVINKYLAHAPVRHGNGFSIAAERYYLRQSSGYSPFASPFSQVPYNNWIRYYETDAGTRVDFDAEGHMIRIKSFSIPSQSHDALKSRIIILPDRPPLCMERSTPKIGLPNAEDTRRLTWSVLQPTVLGFTEGQIPTLQRLVEEGTLCYAYGTGQDRKRQTTFYFLTRLPQGKTP